jgi:hypothetical protein
MSFIKTPSDNMYSKERVGGVKALENALMILGNGPDEILEYLEVPTAVALAWRDALVNLLSGHRPNRPLRQLDWLAIAASADPTWAAANGWVSSAAAAPGGTAAAA